MNIVLLRGTPPPGLARRLRQFERQFLYPLGDKKWFRISHGRDYAAFYRCLGKACCFVAIDNGRPVGTVSAALRECVDPRGNRQPIFYIGDLKVDAAARGRWILWRLGQRALEWGTHDSQAAYSVVMQGNTMAPPDYTGRAGLPKFQVLGRVGIFRMATKRSDGKQRPVRNIEPAAGLAKYRTLSVGCFALVPGRAVLRAERPPQWLATGDGQACGCLEDTGRVKRLYNERGVEMRSAHLSNFVYGNTRAGFNLIATALDAANRRGFPFLFTALPIKKAAAFKRTLASYACTMSEATVYGTGLTPGYAWLINTAEV